MSLGIAITSFFKCLSNKEFAEKVKELSSPASEPSAALEENKITDEPAIKEPKTEIPKEPEIKKPERSEALTLLSILQREARLIDFLQEDISSYQDDQIGAAVRDVHKKSAEVLKNYFKIKSFLATSEGENHKVPSGFDPAEFQLSGKVSGNGPFNGVVEHCGWVAEKIELPKWQGKDSSAMVIAPAEIEVNS